MATRTRRHLDIWPGYVDVLSTLLMVIIFTLMIFVIAQVFLSHALSGRDQALAELSQKVSELGDMLALEKTTNTDLRSTIAELSAQLQQSTADRDKMKQQLATTTSDRDAIAAALAAAQANAKNKAATDAGAKAEVDAKLEDAYKVIDADRAKVQTLLGDIAALESLRDDLTQKLANSSTESAGLKQQLTASQAAAAGLQNQAADLKTKLGISQADAEAARKLTTEAELQIELLNRQMTAMREQLAQLSAALDVSEAKAKADEVQITDLGKRLNEALVNKVAELARYRSEFFGKLREVLGNRSDVQIVGDRFIFQSEVLFATASADIGEEGKKQLAAFAATLKDISAKIPTDIDWLLRVDGHTDKQAYHGRLGTNWELSTARAIAVVKFLIDQGIPPNRLVAAGFAEFRPLADGDSPEDLRRNRRIELKLDQR
ncbi:MAG TPA: peptidoglycan -binding protein [Candidatus Polarisedimenticolia bacterium]|jgi:chemotaxis protein MotB|nr:peptidoglycan -binding protein [Candidatus Polarisedimenticolia bacterium]